MLMELLHSYMVFEKMKIYEESDKCKNEMGYEFIKMANRFTGV